MINPNPVSGAKQPLVSVVMAAHNEENYIGEAIASILSQTYQRLELIVVDDYSSDRTCDVVRSFSDPRVVLYVKRCELPGEIATRNIAVELARGELVAYQDADDTSHPCRLQRQVAEWQAGERPRIVGSWIQRKLAGQSRTFRLPVPHAEIVAGFYRLYDRATFVSGTMLLPRRLALAVPGRPRFRYFGDWDQLCRLEELGEAEFRNVPEVLFTYNIRTKGCKGQVEWARYNAFERACRARRRAGRAEWETAEEFESYLQRSPWEWAKWRALRGLLGIKVRLEMLPLRRSHSK
jgi:glycosyltransferase involved in cell wall biosynthesis